VPRGRTELFVGFTRVDGIAGLGAQVSIEQGLRAAQWMDSHGNTDHWPRLA